MGSGTRILSISLIFIRGISWCILLVGLLSCIMLRPMCKGITSSILSLLFVLLLIVASIGKIRSMGWWLHQN